MYQEGKRIISHHRRHVIATWTVLLVVALIVGGMLGTRHFLKADTKIGKPPAPVVNTVVAAGEPAKPFTEGIFTIDLPKDWIYIGRSHDTYQAYEFENTSGNKGVETLAVYVDTIPTNLGVNQVLPVEADGDSIVPTSVSGNCAGFTGNKVPGAQATPAKWDNINFLCDLANYERNVVGTSSQNAINSVTLTGKTTGSHRLFFTYTDNGSEPNYQIFYNALQSFQLN